MAEYTTDKGSVISCKFPAAALRAYHAELIADVKVLEEVGLGADLRPYMSAILSIERLRLDHEDIAGCRCWYSAEELARIDALAGASR
jgi:hypothetical protein